jgi:hypothetical protein
MIPEPDSFIPDAAEPDSFIPDAAERARLNAALRAGTAESGFWDDQGRPAPWPDDIEDWTPETHPSHTDRPHDF